MAQTKRKRRTKHRGNAAGMVEQRGRTGRKLEESERKPAGGPKGRPSPLDREPSWRSSANRAVIAAAVFIAAVIVIFHQAPAQAFSLGAFMFLLYIPMGYYTDSFMYKRRQAKKARG